MKPVLAKDVGTIVTVSVTKPFAIMKCYKIANKIANGVTWCHSSPGDYKWCHSHSGLQTVPLAFRIANSATRIQDCKQCRSYTRL